jgi:hypothetical protein
MTSNVVSGRRRDQGEGRQLSPEQAAAAAMVALKASAEAVRQRHALPIGKLEEPAGTASADLANPPVRAFAHCQYRLLC